MTPDQLPVLVYLSPDPLDDDFELEFISDLPGFIKNVEEPLFDEANLELYKTILSLTEQHVRKALKLMWPLIKGKGINSIQVCVDVTGTIMKGNGVASYFYYHNMTEDGKYVFFLHRKLLFEYLKTVYEANYELSVHSELTWIHEFIHLLDDSNIKKAAKLQHSRHQEEVITYYLLKYREEGVAELPYTLKGHNDIKLIGEARIKFLQELVRVKQDLMKENVDTNLVLDPFLKSYSFYELGPWLVIDVLLRAEGSAIREHAEKCISMLNSMITITDQDILTLVQYALSIDNDKFLLMTQELMASTDLT